MTLCSLIVEYRRLLYPSGGRSVRDHPTTVATDTPGHRDSPGGLDNRLAARLPIHEGVVVELDGNPAMLVDLSTTGAQVLSPTSLRPGQRVRMSMVDEESSLKFGATVVRASFELSTGRGFTGYRAGVNFLDADRARVADFCNRNRKPSERHAAAAPVEPPPPPAPPPTMARLHPSHRSTNANDGRPGGSTYERTRSSPSTATGRVS